MNHGNPASRSPLTSLNVQMVSTHIDTWYRGNHGRKLEIYLSYYDGQIKILKEEKESYTTRTVERRGTLKTFSKTSRWFLG